MKNNITNSRRDFLGALALGAAASGLSVFGNPLHASTNVANFDKNTLGDPEKWFEKIKGTHRIVYDGSTPHDSFPIIWNWAFYLSNNQAGTPDEDMTAMTVLRHNAIAFALKDALWAKYKLGEFFKITDLTTGEPAVRNMVYEPGDGDFILPGIDGIKRLQERGAMFCVCNLALNVYSGFLAKGMNMEADAVYKEMVDGVLPGVQIVPSGVWALGRAQEHGCGYIFAGG
ncbi:twin-arginine translocation signal domain-containing protein [Gaetbulibacter aestuarii]|uniref:Twin-arginine translocation signal domain-containing protein n=1 Tax=Gaetbulibacter aestuarii TaxID=1502358 RepID=A0ABW7N301_9FLAO